MKFTITEKIEDTHKADSFYLEVTVMYGDADRFETLELGPFTEPDFSDLEEIIDLFCRMKEAFPNGRMGGGRDNYDNVPGFVEWFVAREAEPKWWKYLGEYPKYESWPVEEFDYETHVDPYKWQVFYYNENHAKHRVRVSVED